MVRLVWNNEINEDGTGMKRGITHFQALAAWFGGDTLRMGGKKITGKNIFYLKIWLHSGREAVE